MASFKVIVMPLVSEAIGRLLRGNRQSVLAVLNRLYDQLENHAERWQGRRNPRRPEDYFDYLVNFFGDEGWHTFRFVVNDRQAPGYLFVDAVGHRLGRFLA